MKSLTGGGVFAPIEPTSGTVSTGMGDRVRVQFPMRDIYLGM